MKPKTLIKVSLLALSILCIMRGVKTQAKNIVNTKVEYNQASTYNVSLTKKVQLGEDKTSTYNVHVSGDIASNEELIVKPKDDVPQEYGINCLLRDYSIATNKKNDIIAQVSQDKEKWRLSNLDADATGIIEAEELSAGDWLGLVNFDIHIVPLGEYGTPQELAMWNYTIDEEDRTVTLNYYDGNEIDVVVCSGYYIGNIFYRTKIASNPTDASGPYMFYDMLGDESKTKLIKSIYFAPNIDTSETINMSAMFKDCEALSSLDVSNLNTSNANNMKSMFKNCTSLISLDLSNFTTSEVENMGSMFDSCYSLTSLDISNFDTSKTRSMYYMFNDCESLTSLDLSHFDTSNANNMEGMFALCDNLTTLDISSFATKKVCTTFYFLYKDKKLETVYVGPDWNLDNVSSHGRMLYGCTLLRNYDDTCYDKTKAHAGENGCFTLKQ